MRVCICLSHSIEEYDQVKLFHSLGYEVFSIGGYINPHAPHDPKRPALPDVPHYPDLQRAVDETGAEQEDHLGLAQSRIPEEVLHWLGPDGVLIYHHYLSRLYSQWEHLREWRESGGRVVWRTVGQSVENNEREAAPYRADGLEIVRYSPKERNIPGYAGEDALIRFYKDPAEWGGFLGDDLVVTNVTQHMVTRHPWTNGAFYAEATKGLPCKPAGPGSELLPGGLGEIPLEEMQDLLRHARVYLYTGTQPASYTLGLLEALITGIPVVSIGRNHMEVFPYGKDLFEGEELSLFASDHPLEVHNVLQEFLDNEELAARCSAHQRHRAILEFGIGAVGKSWSEFLG